MGGEERLQGDCLHVPRNLGNQGPLHEDIVNYFGWAEKSGFKEIAYTFHET